MTALPTAHQAARLTARRALVRFAAVAVSPLLLTAAIQVLAVTPAQAHGAPDNPVSRTYACSPEGAQSARSSAACKAAVAVSGKQAFVEWDNLRVPDINGRDRQLIPDGKLCSGGLALYRGLDLPRADWPATKVTAGASFKFTYRTTIPHAGTFRMYVTKDSYDPTKPLTWSDVESKPFLTASNPPISGGAYVMPGRLPTGKTGRHMIFTIWQTTPDTYYSCSDALFTAAAGTGAQAAAPTRAAATQPAEVAPPTSAAIAQATNGGAAPASPTTVTIAKASNSQSSMVSVAAIVFGILAIAGVAGTFAWRRRRTV
jgi:chitin-binding protein